MRNNGLNFESVETDPFGSLLKLARDEAGPKAVRASLTAAAALVEHAAYELARLDGATQVARLILLSSELEQLAQTAVDCDGAGASRGLC